MTRSNIKQSNAKYNEYLCFIKYDIIFIQLGSLDLLVLQYCVEEPESAIYFQFWILLHLDGKPRIHSRLIKLQNHMLNYQANSWCPQRWCNSDLKWNVLKIILRTKIDKIHVFHNRFSVCTVVKQTSYQCNRYQHLSLPVTTMSADGILIES
jgi:hypothetical protein